MIPFLLLSMIIERLLIHCSKMTKPVRLNYYRAPILQVFLYDKDEVLAMSDQSFFTYDKEGKVSPYPLKLSSKQGGYYSSSLYSLWNNKIALICGESLISIFDKSGAVIKESDKGMHYANLKCSLRELDLNQFLITSFQRTFANRYIDKYNMTLINYDEINQVFTTINSILEDEAMFSDCSEFPGKPVASLVCAYVNNQAINLRLYSINLVQQSSRSIPTNNTYFYVKLLQNNEGNLIVLYMNHNSLRGAVVENQSIVLNVLQRSVLLQKPYPIRFKGVDIGSIGDSFIAYIVSNKVCYLQKFSLTLELNGPLLELNSNTDNLRQPSLGILKPHLIGLMFSNSNDNFLWFIEYPNCPEQISRNIIELTTSTPFAMSKVINSTQQVIFEYKESGSSSAQYNPISPDTIYESTDTVLFQFGGDYSYRFTIIERTSQGTFHSIPCWVFIKVCFLSCKTCSAFGDEDNQHCLECKPRYNFYSDKKPGNCYSFFLPNYYLDKADETYKPCHEYCQSCIGPFTPTHTNCESCRQGYFFHPIRMSQCLKPTDIVNEYYFIPVSNAFNKCWKTCETCSDGGSQSFNHCDQCKTGHTSTSVQGYLNCDPICVLPKIIERTTCTQQCNDFYIPERNECVTDCSIYGYFLNLIDNQCYSQCLWGIYTDYETMTCDDSCGPNKFIHRFECVRVCPQNTFYDNNTMTCAYMCPPRTFGNNQLCESSCPLNKFIDPSNNMCVNECPFFYFNNVCVQSCTIPTPIQINKQCLSTCPPNTFLSNGKCFSQCQGYLNPSTNACVLSCQALSLKNDEVSMTCANTCPRGTIEIDPNTCNDSCASGYADLDSSQCSSTCPSNTFINTLNSQCVDTCHEFSMYIDTTQQACVKSCPTGTIADNLLGKCIDIPPVEVIIKSMDDYILELNKYYPEVHDQISSYIFYKSVPEDKENLIKKYANLSAITLNDCESMLKSTYNLAKDDYFLIAKIDTVTTNRATNNVSYVIYSSKGVKLDLSVCDSQETARISVESPLMHKEVLNFEEAEYYSGQGIDIYNASDPFFTSICYPFTTQHGTDIPLKDRQSDILQNATVLCYKNCKYDYLNYTKETVTCKCNCKEEPENFWASFKTALFDSNFEIVSCYNMVFNLEIFIKNFGNFFGLALLCLLYLNYFVFIFVNMKPIYQYINQLHNKKVKENVRAFFNQSPKEERGLAPVVYQKSKGISRNNKQVNGKPTNDQSSSSSSSELKIINQGKTLDDSNQQRPVQKNYDEEELDGLDFEEALLYDKRSFIKIYWCFLKNSHPLIYCFFVKSRKSIKNIKIATFLFGILMDFMLSAFFYSDNYISKSYKGQGESNSFLDNLPISFYTYLFGFLINRILNFFADTESSLDKLNEQKTDGAFNNKLSSVVKCIKVKLSIFVIFHILLISFFWYYITVFCSVYTNSQDEWFVSGLLSTAMSMGFPFITSLVFGLLRFGGLRCKSCFLFKIITLISIFL